MSYFIQVLLVDGKKVSAVYGSENYPLLDDIPFDDYEEYSDFLASFYNLSSGELTSRKLMENIIKGDTGSSYQHLLIDPANEKSARAALGAVYGYLHLDICCHFGKRIGRHEDGSPMLTSYLCEIEPDYKAFFNIPFAEDFPHIFCINNADLDAYRAKYLAALKEEYPTDPELPKDIEFIFSQAKESGLDLFFCNT